MGFEQFRNDYLEFIYKSFDYREEDGWYVVTYNYSVPNLSDFRTVWRFSKKNDNFRNRDKLYTIRIFRVLYGIFGNKKNRLRRVSQRY